jgi:hypothetical protein
MLPVFHENTFVGTLAALFRTLLPSGREILKLFQYVLLFCCQKDCPTGELSRKKFLSIYSTLFPEGKAGPFYEHVFRTFDEDGSGRIDFKEFLQVLAGLSGQNFLYLILLV